MRKNLWFIIFGFVVLLAIILFPKQRTYAYYKSETNMISVTIEGAVYKPGKYLVSKGVTLAYVISLSGGLKKDADVSGLSLGGIILEETYVIPFFETKVEEIIIKVDINQVKFIDLLKIPYITEARATEILLYRQKVGQFKTLVELLNVKGIGEVTFDKIKNHFYVG